MATLGELTQEVLSHQFSPSQYTEYVQARLNEALVKLCAEIDFRENLVSGPVVIPAGSVRSVLTSTFQRVYCVHRVNPDRTSMDELIQVPVTELDRLPLEPGTPTHYAIVASGLLPTIQVSPPAAADTELFIRFYDAPQPMLGDTFTPGIPAQYHSLLTYYALYKCYERENDYNAAQYHKQMWDEERHRYKGQAQYDADDYGQPSQVPGWVP